MTRTPEERERMYQWLYETGRAGYRWPMYGTTQWQDTERTAFHRILAAAPQLWDSLPPDPAEAARKEAEEDGATVERSRIAREMWIRGGHQRDEYPLDVGDLLDVIDRMTARAAAGHPALIAPKGES